MQESDRKINKSEDDDSVPYDITSNLKKQEKHKSAMIPGPVIRKNTGMERNERNKTYEMIPRVGDSHSDRNDSSEQDNSFFYDNPRYTESNTENAENLLIFKNNLEKTVEKNSHLAFGRAMKQVEPEEKSDKSYQRVHSHSNEKSREDDESSIEMRESIFNSDYGDKKKMKGRYDEDENKVKRLIGSDIQPISSFTTTHQSFRRIPINPERIENDPLAELRNVAKIEASNFRDNLEETYFSPPVSPNKHPLQYLKKAISNEERMEPAEPRHRAKKASKDVSTAVDSEIFDFDPKAANDFDESIFNYSQQSKLFYCPWEGCGKSFPSLSRIKRHYIIHTKLKPFRCLNKGCIRRFSRKDNMLQHYRVHCPFANPRNS